MAHVYTHHINKENPSYLITDKLIIFLNNNKIYLFFMHFIYVILYYELNEQLIL